MIVNKINFVIVDNHHMVIWCFVRIYIVKENGFISIVLNKVIYLRNGIVINVRKWKIKLKIILVEAIFQHDQRSKY